MSEPPFSRTLLRPKKSFFLFGPRGVGKSTWLHRSSFARITIDLLLSANYLELAANPGALRERLAHLDAGDWVILDEIQRVPALLDEVHWLYENRRLNFALTGSSARKLKRGGANLLAGRALQTFMFPLTSHEMGDEFDPSSWIEWGALPLVVTEPELRRQTLATYVETYLRQELMEEGLIRKLEPFARFLRVMGLVHGQVLNVENIARDAHVGRTTIDKYIEVLDDTLVAFKLPAYRPGHKVKEVAHSKLYLFDAGVARACAGLLDDPLDGVSRGFAFETGVLNEVRAYNHYAAKNRELSYYRVSSGIEIDLVIETRRKTHERRAEVVLVEIKSAKKWDRRWSEAMNDLATSDALDVRASYGVYLGVEEQRSGGVHVLPLQEFLRRLHAGRIY